MIKQNFNEGWVFHRGSGGSLAALLAGGDGEENFVTLPHDASIQRPRNPEGTSGNGYFSETCCHYTKTFTLPQAEEKIAWLEFEGVYQNGAVYVNNAFAGKCPYGYGNFFVDITRFLRTDGPNEIKVAVKNGAVSGRWYTGEGIYRGVNLMVAKRIHLIPNGVRLSTAEAEDNLAVVDVQAVVEHRDLGPRKITVRTVLVDEGGNEAAMAEYPLTALEGTKNTCRMKLYVDSPKLWSTETPFLYRYRVTLEAGGEILDEEQGTFGIRTVRLDPRNGLRINGKPIKLRGGGLHHDHGIIGAMDFPHAEEERIRKLKAAGYNAVRSAHYPASRRLLEACDREGMLLMDEFSDVWMTTKVDFDYGMSMTEWWEHDIQNMVDKDFNHPCVIFYSIGNEIAETGNEFDCGMGRALSERVRRLDPGRFVVNCVNPTLSVKHRIPEILEEIRRGNEGDADQIAKAVGKGDKEINNLMSDLGSLMQVIVSSESVGEAIRESAAQVDVLGYNYAAARYEADLARYPNRILMGSETYPQDLDVNWELTLRYPQVIGDFSWTAWDYLGEAGIGQISYGEEKLPGLYGGYPYKAANCGDFDLIGDRSPVSYWRQIIWGLRKAPYIAVRPPMHYGEAVHMSNWRMTDAERCWNWEGFEGRTVVIEVYSDAERVRLYQGERLIGEKAPGETKRAVALFESCYSPEDLTAVAVTGGRETGRDVLRAAKAASRLMAISDRERIPADGSDICYVDIRVCDEEGNLAVHRTDPVSVRLEGPGEIIGFGSADPRSTENYFDRTARLYRGRLRAALRGNGTPGVMRLHVTLGDEERVVEVRGV